MSVRATSWAWELGRAGAVKGGELLTLLRIADHADNDGVCWPGEKSIAEYTAQGGRTVRRHLSDMADAGLLHRETVLRKEGRGRSYDGIFLHLDQVANLAGRKTDDQPAKSDRPTGQIEHDQPAKSDTPLYREPSVEPSGTESEAGTFVLPTIIDAPLRQVAVAKSAALDPAAIGRALKAYPDPDHAEEAEKFAAWHLHGKGRNAHLSSVAAGFRNWLKRAEPVAAGSSGRPNLSVVGAETATGRLPTKAERRCLLHARARLRQSLPASTFALWVKSIRLAGVTDDTVHLHISEGNRAWAERRYSALMAKALEETGLSQHRVSFARLEIADEDGRAAA